jgi:hypothetical protein
MISFGQWTVRCLHVAHIRVNAIRIECGGHRTRRRELTCKDIVIKFFARNLLGKTGSGKEQATYYRDYFHFDHAVYLKPTFVVQGIACGVTEWF